MSTNFTPPPVRVDHATQTVRPATPEGNSFYGLVWGTNGTAATCRRALVAPAGYRWVRSNGLPPYGLTSVPSSTPHFSSPWVIE